MDTEYVGAVKIKDGLFIGDKETSQDLDFIITSKVTHIINTSETEVENEWSSIGILYVSFPWLDVEEQIIFDESNTNFEQCYDFIEKCLEAGESVLIHSVKGESRCACVVLAYLMRKYKWALTKSLEFLNSRKPDCKIKPNFLFQLVRLENRLARIENISYSKNWDLSDNAEEILLRNTYLNSRPGIFYQYENSKLPKKSLLKWADGGKKDRIKLEGLNIRNTVEDGFIVLKSCVKGKNEILLVKSKPLSMSSKSCNALATKNFSDSAKEYGSFEDLNSKKTSRTNSASKRENSPLLKDFRKNISKLKKKIPAFALIGFVETNTSKKSPLNCKIRNGSARPASPYVKKEIKECPVKSQAIKPTARSK